MLFSERYRQGKEQEIKMLVKKCQIMIQTIQKKSFLMDLYMMYLVDQ